MTIPNQEDKVTSSIASTEAGLNATGDLASKLNVSNEDFLNGVFGTKWNTAHVCSFKEDPFDLDKLGLRHYWAGGHAKDKLKYCLQDYNTYFTISQFELADDGKARRRKDLFAATYVICFDDVVEKIDPDKLKNLPEPSYVLETSAGSSQWGYILEKAETNQNRVDALLSGLVAAGITDTGKDPGMTGVTRYVRMPVGSNTKKKYKSVFKCKLTTWEPDKTYRLEDLAKPFSIDVTNVSAAKTKCSTGIPETLDPIVPLLLQAGIFRGKLKPDTYDIACPWVGDHTGGADSGAAYLSPFGFRCHHGHCDQKHFGDLLDYLDEEIPGSRDAVIWAQAVHDFDGKERWPFEIAETWKTLDDVKYHSGFLLCLKTLDSDRYKALKEKLCVFADISPDEISRLETAAQDNTTKVIEAELVPIMRDWAGTDPQSNERLKEALTLADGDYYSRRKEFSKALGMPVAVLDGKRKDFEARVQKRLEASDAEIIEDRITELEADGVPLLDGETLLAEITGAMAKYVYLPPHALFIIALWAIYNWCFELRDITPRLYFSSPLHASGKSTAAKVVSCLSRHPKQWGVATRIAVLFRLLAKMDNKCTLLINEADELFRKNDPDLIGTINAGHDRSEALHLVNAPDGKDGWEPVELNTFAPMIISGLNKHMPATTRSRCIEIPIKRLPQASADKIQKFRRIDQVRLRNGLALKIEYWVLTHYEALKNQPVPAPVAGLPGARDDDNIEPLLTIAEFIGPSVAKEARAAAHKVIAVDRVGNITIEQNLLEAARAAFATKYPAILKETPASAALATDRYLTGKELLSHLALDTAGPWQQMPGSRRAITEHYITKTLGKFGLHPAQKRPKGGKPVRAYWWVDCLPEFDGNLGPVDQDQNLAEKVSELTASSNDDPFA